MVLIGAISDYRNRKLQVVLLFGVGSFDIVITLIRMPIIMQSGAMQQSRTLWASIEILVACVVANAPILNNFVQEYRRKRALKRSGEMDSIHSLKNRKIPEGKSRAKKMADSLASKLELGERSDENLTDPERYVIEVSICVRCPRP